MFRPDDANVTVLGDGFKTWTRVVVPCPTIICGMIDKAVSGSTTTSVLIGYIDSPVALLSVLVEVVLLVEVLEDVDELLFVLGDTSGVDASLLEGELIASAAQDCPKSKPDEAKIIAQSNPNPVEPMAVVLFFILFPPKFPILIECFYILFEL